MIDQYKEFFLSDDLYQVIPYAESVVNDDLESFVQVYEPYADQDLMIDPIEICAAYNSNRIFNYLINTYDYSDFYNPFRLTLPLVLMVFERESMLVDALEHISFGPYQFILMYEYMIQNKDLEYFKQFFHVYGIADNHEIDLLKISLNHNSIFNFLISHKNYKNLLTKAAMLFEIIAYHQSMLAHIEDVRDLSKFFDMSAFVNVLKLEDEALFKKTIDFILDRKLKMNEINEFGLTFFHEALRHANSDTYIAYLIEKGANPSLNTSLNFPSSHQLLFRDAEFTIELARLIDFDEKDEHGMTLKDYDSLQRQLTPQLIDILLIVKLVLNMDESAIYELDNADFYDLASIHGVDTFLNVYSVIVFENNHLKEQFHYENDHDINVESVHPLKETLQDAFLYDEETTLELVDDLIALEAPDFERLKAFAKKHKTTLKIATDSAEINKVGSVEITINQNGNIHKEATVITNYVDVYYLHKYYDIPLTNITYHPPVSNKQRFLN